MKPTIVSAFILLFGLVGGSAAALAAPAGHELSRPAAHPGRSTQVLPAALRPALYRALAKDAGPAYRINENGCASLPEQGFKACFDRQGAHFTGTGSLALHLLGWGRGAALAPVKAVPPAITAHRVRYVHGNLTEWWRTLPIGFEQSFTIAKRPGGHGELILALAASGKATRHKGALAWGKLRYGDLVVTDAKGKVIPATLKSNGDHVLIAVSDTHAVYPLTVDPLVWLEEQKVTASDGAAFNNFGVSVALAGTTALVGETGATVNGNPNQGAVYVFTESNGAWTQTAKVTASDGAAGDFFGNSVALSGTTALVGAPEATFSGNDYQGAAYVFDESNGAWTQTAKLTAGDGAAFDFFGASVALADTTALVGAQGATVNGNSGQGAAYVFGESNGTWTQAAKLTASDGAANDIFGLSVALAGTTALVGAQGATVNGNSGQGAAYVFDESGGTWTQTAKLTASDGAAGDFFGISVALAGTTALVGAWTATVNGNPSQGAAYVFDESNGAWTQTAKLTASDGVARCYFGRSVALAGTTALVGAPQTAVNGNSGQGAVYVFDESNGAWTQTVKLTASDGAAGEAFGRAVVLAGTTAFVGVAGANVNGNPAQGAAYFYGKGDLGLAMSAPGTVGQGQQYVSQAIATNNASAASPAVAATMTVPAAASFVSATATQGSCSEDAGVVTCDFGQINGNAGTATANVTLKATGEVGDTIENTASVAYANPALSASAPTTVTEGGACPEGYSEYDGSLEAGQHARSPIYRAPGGQENAILTGPTGFQLFGVFQNAYHGRQTYRIPGNEVHRQAPAGGYTWVVKAGATGGAYTLCVLHP